MRVHQTYYLESARSSWFWTEGGKLRARWWLLPAVVMALGFFWAAYNVSLVLWFIVAEMSGRSAYMELEPQLHALTIWTLKLLSGV